MSDQKIYSFLRTKTFQQRNLTTFPLIQSNEDVDEIVILSPRVKNFIGMMNMDHLISLKLSNTQINSFKGGKILPSLKILFLSNTPISRYTHYRIMALIVFGCSLTTIDYGAVKRSEKHAAEKYNDTLRPLLIDGWVVTMLNPIKLYNPETRQRKSIYLKHKADNEISALNIVRRSVSPNSPISPKRSIISSRISVFDPERFNKNSQRITQEKTKTVINEKRKKLTSIQFVKFLEDLFFVNDLRLLSQQIDETKTNVFISPENIQLFVHFFLIASNIRPLHIRELTNFIKNISFFQSQSSFDTKINYNNTENKQTTSLLLISNNGTKIKEELKAQIIDFEFYSYSILANLLESLLFDGIFLSSDLKPLFFCIYDTFENWESSFSLFHNNLSLPFFEFFSIFSNIIKKVDIKLFKSLYSHLSSDQKDEIKQFMENDNKKMEIWESLQCNEYKKYDDFVIQQTVINLTPWTLTEHQYIQEIAAVFAGSPQIISNKSISSDGDQEFFNEEIYNSASVSSGCTEICHTLNMKDYADVAIQFHRFNLLENINLDEISESIIEIAINSMEFNAIEFLLKTSKLSNETKRKITEIGLEKYGRYTSFIKFIFDLAAEVNIIEDFQKPFLLSIPNGVFETVNYFVSKKISINQPNSDGLKWTALHYASAQMLKTNPQNNFHLNKQYAEKECEKIMNLFLSFPGVNINIQDSQGNTPLMIAIACNNLKGAKMLASRDDCDPNIVDNNGYSPLHAAIANPNQDIFLELIRLLNSKTNPKKKYTIDVNSHSNKYLETPIIIAAKTGHVAAIKELLKNKKIDVNIQDINNETALIHAIKNHHQASAKAIIESGLSNDLKAAETLAQNENLKQICVLISKMRR